MDQLSFLSFESAADIISSAQFSLLESQTNHSYPHPHPHLHPQLLSHSRRNHQQAFRDLFKLFNLNMI